MDPERLYARLPIPLQNCAASLEGWRIRRRRFNAEFRELLRACRRRSEWSAERTAEFRDHRLAEFVARAAASTPHYRALFARLGIDPGAIRSPADLQALPVLTRREVQDDVRAFVSESVPARDTLTCHTSGSTGAGLRFPVTWRAHREQWAVWWRYRGWHGLQPGVRCLYVGGRSVVPPDQRRPPFWRYNRAGRQILFSSYHLNRETAPAYLEEMRRSNAPWVHGYPSMVALIADHMLQEGVRLDVRWVTLGAENVMPHQVAVIERAFGVRPIDHYGMTEGVANVSRCPRGTLHVDEDFAAVEFLPLDGDQYRIVGTNLSNPAFPLIRYDTGDVATLSDGRCDCGRPGRVVRSIDGRQEDYVIARDGSRLGRLDHIFKDLTRIREAQIRQERPGHMTLCVVPGPGYTERDERALREETAKRVGDGVAFDVEYVDAIPRTARGKLRFVVSTVEDGRISSPAG